MSERIKFTVYRDTWLRGIGSHNSFLLAHDGKRCCLGHMARDLGADDGALLEVCTPRASSKEVRWPESFLATDEAEITRNSDLAFRLMSINDDETLSDVEREERLTATLAQAGIDVEFRDSAEVTP